MEGAADDPYGIRALGLSEAIVLVRSPFQDDLPPDAPIPADDVVIF